MTTLDEIREAIIAKFNIITKYDLSDDYYVVKWALFHLKADIPTEEFNTYRKLMFNFSANDNILLLQLIYKKYVKPKE